MPVPRPMAPNERRHSSREGKQRRELRLDHLAVRLLDGEQDLGDAEQAHHHRNEADAVIEARGCRR